jgi:hypothetical protein
VLVINLCQLYKGYIGVYIYKYIYMYTRKYVLKYKRFSYTLKVPPVPLQAEKEIHRVANDIRQKLADQLSVREPGAAGAHGKPLESG